MSRTLAEAEQAVNEITSCESPLTACSASAKVRLMTFAASVVQVDKMRNARVQLLLDDPFGAFMRITRGAAPRHILVASPWVSDAGRARDRALDLLGRARRHRAEFTLVTRSRATAGDVLAREVDGYAKGHLLLNVALHAKVYLSVDEDRTLLVVGSANITNGSAWLREAAVLLEFPPSRSIARSIGAQLMSRRIDVAKSTPGRFK